MKEGQWNHDAYTTRRAVSQERVAYCHDKASSRPRNCAGVALFFRHERLPLDNVRCLALNLLCLAALAMDHSSLLFTAATALLPNKPQLLGLSPPQIVVVLQQLLQLLSAERRIAAPNRGDNLQRISDSASASEDRCSAGLGAPMPSSASAPLAVNTASCSPSGESGRARTRSADERHRGFMSTTTNRWMARVMLALVAHYVAVEALSLLGQREKSKWRPLTTCKSLLQSSTERLVALAKSGSPATLQAALPIIQAMQTMLFSATRMLQVALMQAAMAPTKLRREALSDMDLDSRDTMTGPSSEPRRDGSSATTRATARSSSLAASGGTTASGDTSAAIEVLKKLSNDEQASEARLGSRLCQDRPDGQSPGPTDPNDGVESGTMDGVAALASAAIATLQRTAASLPRLILPPQEVKTPTMTQGELRRILLDGSVSQPTKSPGPGKL